MRKVVLPIALGLVALIRIANAEPASLPPGFVHLRALTPTILQDMRYASAHNFIGAPVAGYTAAECVVTREAAQALAAAQETLAARRLSLIVWDCYRPERAVREFVRWTQSGDTRMKAEFYPRTEKRDLIPQGYIAGRSAHSRGSTVDIGLVPASLSAPPVWTDGALVPCTAEKGERYEDGAVDLGTGFDCFDSRANFPDREVNATARANRALLREVMGRHGFRPYDAEWWHFQLSDEPFPDRAFDFPIPPVP